MDKPTCPITNQPCQEYDGARCVPQHSNQGRTFCIKWVREQQAQGRKELEDRTKKNS